MAPGDWTLSPCPRNGSDTPLVTVAVPSRNQGRFLDESLQSIFHQDSPVEVFLADAGSRDETASVIAKWQSRLAGWRSCPDNGQAAAVNECISLGKAPFVCWLNSDDRLLPSGLDKLIRVLEDEPDAPAAYGRVYDQCGTRCRALRVEPFSERRLAVHCIISQPGTLIRRSAWERVNGLCESLEMALDYDLWWRLYRTAGPMAYTDSFVAVNRNHPFTKTNQHRAQHYREAMAVVKRHHGRLPLKWWLAQPYAVWARGFWASWLRVMQRREHTSTRRFAP